MLRKLTAVVRGLAADPFILGMVGMMLLTRSLDLIAAQITEQAAVVREQVAEAQQQVAVDLGAATRLVPEQGLNGYYTEADRARVGQPEAEPEPA